VERLNNYKQLEQVRDRTLSRFEEQQLGMQCSLIGNEKRDDVDTENRDAGISGFRPVPTTDTDDGVELSQSSISNEESAPAAGRCTTCGSLLLHNLMPDEGLFGAKYYFRKFYAHLKAFLTFES